MVEKRTRNKDIRRGTFAALLIYRGWKADEGKADEGERSIKRGTFAANTVRHETRLVRGSPAGLAWGYLRDGAPLEGSRNSKRVFGALVMSISPSVIISIPMSASQMLRFVPMTFMRFTEFPSGSMTSTM